MTTNEQLARAFSDLQAARRNDTGTSMDARRIAMAAHEVHRAAEALTLDRIMAQQAAVFDQIVNDIEKL